MSDTHIDCCCGAKYMRKRGACPECGGTEGSKTIRLVLSAAALKRLETIIHVGGIAMSYSPATLILAQIVKAMLADDDICSLKTAEERAREGLLYADGYRAGTADRQMCARSRYAEAPENGEYAHGYRDGVLGLSSKEKS